MMYFIYFFYHHIIIYSEYLASDIYPWAPWQLKTINTVIRTLILFLEYRTLILLQPYYRTQHMTSWKFLHSGCEAGQGLSLFLSVLLLTRFSALRVEYITETQFHA